jgi:tetratricopeptide (TPR) repeat protein
MPLSIPNGHGKRSRCKIGACPIVDLPQPRESANDLITSGKALQAQGKHAEALPLFERATTLDPNSAAAWNSKGAALGSLGCPQEALAAFDRALVLNPNAADAWSNKAGILRALGRDLAAMETERQAKERGSQGWASRAA